MYWSRTLIPTAKEVPADAEVLSHQLMIRAGLVRKLAAGIYDWLPLGWRVMTKINNIIRQEMNAAGADEMLLPAILPADLWKQTGRYDDYGPDLFRLKDRKGAEFVLGPTHEEPTTELIKAYISSYKQLPVTLYQIQQKFRDEARPRNGLMRVREFFMKDAYSFHASLDCLSKTYQDIFNAYVRICARCGINAIPVEAESGPIGGDASHEFILPCDTGEDVIVLSDKNNYAANLDRAQRALTAEPNFSGPPSGDLDKVHTPNLPGIEGVGKFLKVKPKDMLKSLVYRITGESAGKTKFVLAVVRGDHDVNEAKLRNLVKKHFPNITIALADLAEAKDAGFAIGFVGPHAANNRPDTLLLVDADAALSKFWAAGANEIDYHIKHFSWSREVLAVTTQSPQVADLRNVIPGDLSPKGDGGVLRTSKGIEVGHVFKLGTKYSDALGATFLDEHQQSHSFIMGCYGIGPGRILVGILETNSDPDGIRWPMAIAPYHVIITPIKYEGPAKDLADKLHTELSAKHIDVLVNDRDQRPGFKFKDADLIGIPLRIVIGEKALATNQVELKHRHKKDPDLVPIEGLANHIAALVHASLPH